MNPSRKPTLGDLEHMLEAAQNGWAMAGAAFELYARLELWLRTIERVRTRNGRWADAVLLDTLKGWARSLIGDRAHPDWQIEGGMELLEVHLKERLE